MERVYQLRQTFNLTSVAACDQLHGRQKFIAFDFCHPISVIKKQPKLLLQRVASVYISENVGEMSSQEE